jgi:hypothetical protein
MAKAKSVHSTPRKNTLDNDAARLAAISKKDCPVRAIMQKAVALGKARCALEANNSNKDEVSELWEAKEILLNMASITRAQSLQGALFQLAVLMETLHVDLFQNLPTEVQDEVLEREQKCVRLIFSAASVIEQVIGHEAAAEAKDVWLYDDNLGKIERITNGPVGRCAA